MANDRLDAAQRVDAKAASTSSAGKAAQAPSVDNELQAQLAEQQREYTAGGDGTAEDAPAAAARAAAQVAAVERAVARVRAPERPSPFGVGQFPPLPPPPRRR